VADINAGLFATIGILMALQHRNPTGAGQYVEVSMFDGKTSAMSSNYMAHLVSDEVPKPLGTGFGTVVPYRVFHASDRVFSIAVGSERLWAASCAVIGHSELQSDPAFATNAMRIQNRRTLEATLDRIFKARTAAGSKSSTQREFLAHLCAPFPRSSTTRNPQRERRSL
jgi:CoA:oxalate CoA-transferase